MFLDLSRCQLVVFIILVVFVKWGMFHQKADLEVHPQLCLCGQ
jgi:hypothetical protein